MDLIKELNDISMANEEIASIEIAISEAPNTDIEWEEPTKKQTIIKTPSEENISKRIPTAKKGSGVLLTINDKAIPGTVTDDTAGELVVSYRLDGKLLRVPPQPREKFKFLKISKSGRELFTLTVNVSSNS